MKTDSNITKEIFRLANVDYPLFADYCKYLDKGLRKDALKYLDGFLDKTKDWDYLMRVNFCKTIFSVSSTTNNDIDFLLTANLTEKLIKPTLLEWTTQEPDNYLAFKWYGQYFRDTTFIKKAHKLNPADNSIKVVLLNRLENVLWLSTHHLPEGYLGDIEKDEQDLELAFALFNGLDTKMPGDLLNRFMDYKKSIDKYKSNKKQPSR